ncbi:MAG: hypothetical protein DWB44_04105 [Chloroflexi bacterium]|jgi:hypothetical protein|nr:hypothetical protein [Chloroflexota bacterium]MBV6435623.1 hypothetical protein [Anaerolineae bacterium]MDL1916115.1 hypothetical protein [Anaerolineae bacterium CFX4]OQY79328.1 MAG: hypothetical protein B6D42_15360 [Anaerolineae bacterium UTCFX5]RIK22475.1 MAG: hypothetical protein DCC53_03335 [Chloroflexota bacterium]
MTKPGRPLGLSLAIILSVGLYVVLPMFQLVVQVGLQERISRIDSPIEVHGQELTAGASGGSFVLVGEAELVVQTIAAGVFLVIAILAWRGHPRGIRATFTTVVLLYAGVTAVVTARTLLARSDLNAGISSADELVRQLLCGVLVTTVLIPLYVVWYINRAPARAFYRGTYAVEEKAR